MDEIVGNNILIVTSNSTEKNELEMRLKERGVNLKKMYRSLSSRLKVGVLDGYPVVLLCADRGSFKDDSVGVLLPKVLPYLRPKLALLAGFSYGRRESIQLHDVAISREVVSLVDFKAGSQGLDFRSFPRIVSSIAQEELDTLIADMLAHLTTIFNKLGLKSKLHIGSALSGEVMAENEEFLTSLFAEFPGSLGGDMEGHPFAAHCSAQGCPWLIAKSPSDFGGGTIGTGNGQAYSAKVSAISTVEMASAYAKLKKLSCPESIVSALEASPGEPLECLVMPDETGIHANSDYPASIRKFVTMLALPQAYNRDFQDHLVGLVKEIAENATKHERSTTVYLRGSADQMIVEYDGQPFDIVEKFREMRVGGGGKGEFDSFNQLYTSDNPIAKIEWEHSSGKNRVMFKFLYTGSDLRRNFFCSLYLNVDEIREYAYGFEPSFSELSGCETVWLNAENTLVSLSDWYLLLQLVRKIPKTVNAIKVHGCPGRLVAKFREHFSQFDPRLEFI